MKRIKINIAIIAMLLGVTAAFASTNHHKKDAGVLYGLDTDANQWVDLTGKSMGTTPGKYSCDASQDICTAIFDQAPTGPNDRNFEPGSATTGSYDQH